MKDKKLTVTKVHGILTGAAIILLGVLFIIAALTTFSEDALKDLAEREGVSTLTGEILRAEIGRRITSLLPLIIVVAVLIVAGPILEAALHVEKPKDKISHDSARTLAIVKRKNSESKYTVGTAVAVLRERRLRANLTLVGALLFAISLVYPLIRVFSSDTFTTDGDANVQVLTTSAVVTAFLIPTVVYAIVMTFIFSASRNRECELLKRREEGEIVIPERTCPIYRFISNNSKVIVNTVRICFVLAAVAYIILGVLNGGMADVLAKAAKICRECIGLG